MAIAKKALSFASNQRQSRLIRRDPSFLSGFRDTLGFTRMLSLMLRGAVALDPGSTIRCSRCWGQVVILYSNIFFGQGQLLVKPHAYTSPFQKHNSPPRQRMNSPNVRRLWTTIIDR